MEINQIEVGKEIQYDLIERDGFTEAEHGQYICGENFLVFKNKSGLAVSFVLIGHSVKGGIYKCVYSDFIVEK